MSLPIVKNCFWNEFVLVFLLPDHFLRDVSPPFFKSAIHVVVFKKISILRKSVKLSLNLRQDKFTKPDKIHLNYNEHIHVYINDNSK